MKDRLLDAKNQFVSLYIPNLYVQLLEHTPGHTMSIEVRTAEGKPVGSVFFHSGPDNRYPVDIEPEPNLFELMRINEEAS